MSDSPRYYAAPASTFPLGRAMSLIVPRDGSPVREIDALSTHVLAACRGVSPLQQHALVASHCTQGQEVEAIIDSIGTLLGAGLLRPLEPPPGERETSSAPPVASAIETIAFITADRPALLARGLRSALAHARAFGHEPSLLVVDGSRAQAAETAAAVDQVARESGAAIRYVGARQAAALRRSLVSAGVSRRACEIALAPGQIGSNRNLVTLLTAGRRVLMVDDDVRCEPWESAHRTDDVAFVGHTDQREWRFVETREKAIAGVTRSPVDLLAAHGQMLGRSMASLVHDAARPAQLRDACGHLVAALAAGGRGTVRVSLMGVAGDSGRYCSHRLLFLSGSLHEALRRDERAFASALSSREIQNVATRTTVTHEAVCMSYCMGVDNRQAVPPFIPFGRGEDTLFGTMLAMGEPDVLFAHLPFGIIHDSHRPSPYGEEQMPSARETRLSELLMYVGDLVSRGMFGATPAARLGRFAQALTELSAMAPDRFLDLVRRAAIGLRCLHVTTLDATLAAGAGYGPHWRAALDEYERAFRASLVTPAFFLPLEFAGSRSVPEGFRRLQAFLADFAVVIEAWPEMWAAAARLDHASQVPRAPRSRR